MIDGLKSLITELKDCQFAVYILQRIVKPFCWFSEMNIIKLNKGSLMETLSLSEDLN